MTPESTRLARELVSTAIFHTRERRVELLRQVKALPDQARDLRAEAARLEERTAALRQLDLELGAAHDDIFS